MRLAEVWHRIIGRRPLPPPPEDDPDIQDVRRKQHDQINTLQGLMAKDYRDRWSERRRDAWEGPT